MIKGPEIRIMRGGHAGLHGLCVWIDQTDIKTHTCHIAEPLVMKECELFAEVQPTLTITSEAGQQLMDDLWQAGLRPSEGTGSAGALAAVEKHLKDMRTIAFNRLKIGDQHE